MHATAIPFVRHSSSLSHLQSHRYINMSGIILLKSKGKKIPATHPTMSAMVTAAIREQKEKKGSSLPAIKKYLAANYNVDAAKEAPSIRKFLKAAVAKGDVVQTNGSGRYSLPVVVEAVAENSNIKRNQTETVKPIDTENAPVYFHTIDEKRITAIKICDYKMLSADKFVNDIIIEFFMNYSYKRKLSDHDQNRTYLFNTFFYTQLTRPLGLPVKTTRASARFERVKKWTKNVNIFEKDFIFIPINENNHWFLAVICYPYLDGPITMEDGTPIKIDDEDARPPHPHLELSNPDRDEMDGNHENLWNFTVDYSVKCGVSYAKDVERVRRSGRPLIKQPCILIFDSLSGGVRRSRIVATLREWLVEEYRSQFNGAVRDFSRNVMKGSLVKVPQQPNYTDCGLFVLHIFDTFFEHPIVDYTMPIVHLENWYSIDEVSKGDEKRREVQNAILQLRQEKQYHLLPGLVDLPTLRFTSKHLKSPDSPNTCNPTSTCDTSTSCNPASTSNTLSISSLRNPNPCSSAIKQHGSQSDSQYQNKSYYNGHAEEIISNSLSESNRIIQDEENYGNDEEEPEEEDLREYYSEIVVNNWSEGGQHENDENFDQYYNATELNRFRYEQSNNGDIIVYLDY